MGSFLSGLVSGGSTTAAARLGAGKKPIWDRKKAPTPSKGNLPLSSQYDKTPSLSSPPSYKRGGKVRKGGMARVHKGERVLTRKQARKYKRGKR